MVCHSKLFVSAFELINFDTKYLYMYIFDR